ncbi:hypothetical protein J6590_054045 [Homalodisca vitripennis]|nr:hypothetical protein J6590_054045 [Homalodisca vitripennis]
MELCPQIRDMCSTLQELYNFMSGHKRHHIFVEKLEKGPCQARKKRLKRVNTTRWSSKNDAVKTVITCYDGLRETLEDISDNTQSETDSRTSAKGLLKALFDYESAAVMIIAAELFKILSPVTVCLQSKIIDYGMIPTVVSETISKLQSMRTDEGWDKMQMTHFSHEKLLNTGDDTLNPDIVSDLCGYYGLDTEKLCEEFDVFSQLYKGSYQNIDLSDVLSSKDDK